MLQRNPSKSVVFCCAAALASCNWFTAFFLAFSRYYSYDDEGYFLRTLRRFLDGQPLYDRVESMYGPFYYFYQWCAHKLAGVPPTNASVRFVNVTLWTAASLLAFVLILHLTRSIPLAVLANLLTFRALDFEPAHPQDLCMMLLLGLVLAACYMSTRPLPTAALSGCIAALLILTKINAGIYLGLALVIVMTRAASRSGLARFGFFASSTAAIVLPVLLMASKFDQTWVICYCLLAVCSIAATIVAIWRSNLDQPANLTVTAAGFVVTFAALLAFAFAHGSTLTGAMRSLILLPKQVMGSWFIPAPMKPVSWVAGPLGLLFACGVAAGRVKPGVIVAAKSIFAVLIIVLCLLDRFGALFSFAGPFLWLIAVRVDGSKARASYPVCLLTALASIYTLYAYPVAGSQVRFIAALMGVACLGSFSEWPSWKPVEWMDVATVPVLVVLAVLYAADLTFARSTYEKGLPLGFPGTEGIRVEAARARNLQAIVQGVPASCDLLVTLPSLPSFNLWTGKPEPERYLIRTFIGAKDDDGEQRELIELLSRHPQSCIIYAGAQLSFWSNRQDLSGLPIIQYMRANYRAVSRNGVYELMLHE